MGGVAGGLTRLTEGLIRPVSLVRNGRKARRRPRPPVSKSAGPFGCEVYQNGAPLDYSGDPYEALAFARTQSDAFVWLGLVEPDGRLLAAFTEAYQLDPLAVHEAGQPSGRPRVELAADSVFLVLRTAEYVRDGELRDDSELIDTDKISILLGDRYVVTIRHGKHGDLRPVRDELRTDPALLRHGPAGVLTAVCSRVVARQLAAAQQLTADIDEAEALVFDPGRRPAPGKIYQLKREVLELKHAVTPLAEPLRALAEPQGGSPLVPVRLRRQLREVVSDLDHAVSRVSQADELLTSILQATLTQVTIAQNEDMRRISAWVAIAAVPTAIAGIYGMNFEYIPWADESWGFGVTIAVMVVLCVVLHRAFRRNGWL
ncbi:MAG: magnesium and cobalt transport protein CorA [Frankia sp.]|nr:magnesium and cobalt transport protein CorA [Frankia sp.]